MFHTKRQDKELSSTVLRSFQLDGFGLWNIDHPIFWHGTPIFAKFSDETGKQLDLKHIALVYKGLNGIARFNDNNIRISTDIDNMIWGVLNNKLVYLTFDDFKKCNITSATKEYTFTMRIHPETIKTPEDVKKLVEL